MEGEGNDPKLTNRCNEKNQLPTESLDRESEEWMEEYRSILNSDDPISFQDLLAEGPILNPNPDARAHPEMIAEPNAAPPHNNGDNRGKNLIINLDDDSDDEDDRIDDAMRPSHKRKSQDGGSPPRMLVGESSKSVERRQASQEGNFIDLEQPDAQVQAAERSAPPHHPNGAGNGINGAGRGAIPQNLNPPEQEWRSTRRGTHGYTFMFRSPFVPRNRPAPQVPYNLAVQLPIWSNAFAPPLRPLPERAAPPPFHGGYHAVPPPVSYQQVNQNTNFNSTPNRPTSMNYGILIPGNVASGSRAPAASQSHRPAILSSNQPRNFADHFAPAGPRPANLQVEPWRLPIFGLIRPATVSGVIEVRPPARAGNLWPELTLDSLRQAGVPTDVALSLLSVAERATLLNEIRNAIRVLRGNVNQAQPVQNNTIGENSDVHRDMRLDVDGYSHEELLLLEQRIGNVRTGLAEDVIDARLVIQKYRADAFGAPSDNNPCCICQEEYVEEDETAKLECEHYFHFNCIKQWLLLKNNCPICKHTAVSV